MSKLPENQYYIQLDFRAMLFDGTLNSIDDAAQNIWKAMFLQSLSYDDIGHFKVNGKSLLIHDIAKILGKDLKKFKRVLPILLEVGLCEQLEDGTIIIPSSKFDQFACNLHTKYAQNDGKTTAKRRQNAEQNGEKKPEIAPPIKENNINIKESPLTPQGKFNKLSFEDQLIVQQLQSGELPEFLITHYKNHNPSAWRYWEKHRQNKPESKCEIIPLKASA